MKKIWDVATRAICGEGDDSSANNNFVFAVRGINSTTLHAINTDYQHISFIQGTCAIYLEAFHE